GPMRTTLAFLKIRRGMFCFLFAIVALGFSLPAAAQTLYGSLVGTVTDETGLAVPGATVTITHTETNQTREGTTNATGGYNFPNIPTGTYQIDIALAGFQSFKSRGIVVQQNSSVRIDAKLTVGALRSEEHTSELQSHLKLVCRLLLQKKNAYNLSNAYRQLEH